MTLSSSLDPTTMRTLVFALALLSLLAPAAAQTALVVDGPDGLTLEPLADDGKLSPRQEQAVQEGRAAIIGRVGNDGWCLGCRPGEEPARIGSDFLDVLERQRDMLERQGDRWVVPPRRPTPPVRPALPRLYERLPAVDAAAPRVTYRVRGLVARDEHDDLVADLAETDPLVSLESTSQEDGAVVEAVFAFGSASAWADWHERPETRALLAPLGDAETSVRIHR